MTRRTSLRALLGILVIGAVIFLAWDLLNDPSSRDRGVASPGDAVATAHAVATPAPGTPTGTATPGPTGGPATRTVRPARPTAAGTPRATAVAVATPVRAPVTAVSAARGRPTLSTGLVTSLPDAPVVVAGRGFTPGERVTLRLDGIPLPGFARVGAASDGRFTATFIAPEGLPRATGRVVATGATSGVSAMVVLRGASPAATSYVATASGAAVGAGRPAQLLLALSNPASHAAHVRVTLYFGAGATDSAVVLLRARARRTVRLASVSNGSGAFGLALTAGSPVVARMLLAQANARTMLPGTAHAGRTWYLTEGYAGPPGPAVHEVVALLNPDPRYAASVTLRLLVPRRRGDHVAPLRVRVPAHGETAVDIGKVLPGRYAGIVVTATRPIAVARVLSVGRGGAPRLSAGNAALCRGWVFVAAGATGRSETYLSILNPTGRPAHVIVASYDRGGVLVRRTSLTMTALSRAMIALSGALRAHPHGVITVVTGDAPVAVERMVYPARPNASRGKR